jgi:putative heme-binding domain-containing protein
MVDLGAIYSHDDGLVAYGYAEVESPVARKAVMAVGSDDTLKVWVNGKSVFEFTGTRSFSPARDRFEVDLVAGRNSILIRCGNGGGPWQFSVAATTPVEYAFLKGPTSGGLDLATFREAAMKGSGNAEQGRSLFSDAKGLACLKCHAVGNDGGKVGPELSSVGAKYPREELITAVLQPSAKIASGYEPTIFALSDGRVLTGIIKSEEGDVVEILDSEAKIVSISKDEIEERKRSDVSLMPNGLAEGLTPQNFADLIAFLETLKQQGTPEGSAGTPRSAEGAAPSSVPGAAAPASAPASP